MLELLQDWWGVGSGIAGIAVGVLARGKLESLPFMALLKALRDLTRKKKGLVHMKELGKRHGRLLSKQGRKLMGISMWEASEDLLKKGTDHYYDGIWIGASEDDHVK